MPSTFGWLDADTDHRHRMLEVIDLFKEQWTIDKLGVGAIRDAPFPGTSDVHNLLRHVLLIRGCCAAPHTSRHRRRSAPSSATWRTG